MRRAYHFWVYMLRCADGKYYVGVTNDIAARVLQHQQGIDLRSYTHKRRPVTLVYSAYFQYVHDAIAWETRLKKWSHAKKKALSEGRISDLSRLSHTSNNAYLYPISKNTRRRVFRFLSLCASSGSA